MSQEIGEEFVEFLEKELNIADQDFGEAQTGSSKAQSTNNVDSKMSDKNSIEESIDEIEAALAQLKKELGL